MIRKPTHLDRFLSLGPELAEAWPGSCGPGSTSRFFPDGPFGFACRYHDFAYLLGGTKADFIEVERTFKRLLLAAAEASSRPWVWTFVALAYSAHTRVWGRILKRWREDLRPLTARELRATPEFRDAQANLRRSRRALRDDV